MSNVPTMLVGELLLMKERDALRAERDAARELLKKLETTLPNLQRDVMADCAVQIAAMRVEAERRGFEACLEAARQRLAEEARAFLVEFGPSDAARIAMDCMRHAEDVVAKLRPPVDVTVTVREQKGKR